MDKLFKLKNWNYYGFFLIFLNLTFLKVNATNENSNLINIIRNAEGKITLTGPHCNELVEQELSLRNWTMNFKETPGAKNTPIRTINNEDCQLVVHDSVPSIIKKIQDFKSSWNGPNCWNTTLFLTQLNSVIRFTSDQEMSFWMDSPYCRELAETETAQPGDLIAIRRSQPIAQRQFEEVHGMIFISEALVFSKNTSSSMSSYHIQRGSLIYQNFHVDDSDCLKVKGHPSRCHIWANYFRCKSPLNDRELLEKKNPLFASLSQKVGEIETFLSQFVIANQGNFKNQREQLLIDLSLLEKQLNENIIKQDPGIFYFQSLLETIQSLKIQIGIIDKAIAKKTKK